MKNLRVSLNVSTLVALAIVLYAAYYLLLQENCLHSSISSIISYSHHVAMRPHLLILGLLPIYIAAMIFGAVILGLYLGGRLQTILRYFHTKK